MNRSDYSNLLNDDEVTSFIISGYHIVEPDLPQGYNDEICDSLRMMTENPGKRIVEALPKISVVLEHPSVVGALPSMLGPDFVKDPGGHIHMTPPKTRVQPWHQDERFGRGHQDRDIDHIKHVMLMYYPQDATQDMGPTVLLPSSQRRVATPETMVTLVNLKGLVFSTVSAGSVLLTHYDIWHAGTGNRSDRVRTCSSSCSRGPRRILNRPGITTPGIFLRYGWG